MTAKLTLLMGCFVIAITALSTISHAKKSMINLPALSLPIDCTLGKDCFVQNYVDLDPSKGVKDAACGKASYNGHRGVDFALLSQAQMKKGVRVVAALSGRVIGVRNTMPDILIKTPTLARAVKGRECGNGITVQHANGWETQYCHLAQGSINLRKGQKIERGQNIGLVGLSGMTQFPHVHLTVRHNHRIVDPFMGFNASQPCLITGGKLNINTSLWKQDIKQLFPTQTSFISIAGFSDHGVKRSELRLNPPQPPTSIKSAALVLYTRVNNIKKGDRVRFQIFNKQGKIFNYFAPALKRDRARQMLFSGKKKTQKNWQAGQYKGIISLVRNTKIILQKHLMMTLK